MRICVSQHSSPAIPASLYDDLILTPQLPDYDVLVGSAAVPSIIDACAGEGLITLMTHRRCVIRWPSWNTERQNVVSCKELAEFASEEFLPVKANEFMASFPVLCHDGIDMHFEKAHPGCLQYLQDYVYLALGMGLLTKDSLI